MFITSNSLCLKFLGSQYSRKHISNKSKQLFYTAIKYNMLCTFSENINNFLGLHYFVLRNCNAVPALARKNSVYLNPFYCRFCSCMYTCTYTCIYFIARNTSIVFYVGHNCGIVCLVTRCSLQLDLHAICCFVC